MSLDEFWVLQGQSLREFPQGLSLKKPAEQKFKMWSLFPFIARDIAVWVPDNVSSNSVAEIIKENMGELVVRGPELFDEFKKDGRISYAFRIVFQSYDRTLTDEEVIVYMQKITEKLISNSFEIR